VIRSVLLAVADSELLPVALCDVEKIAVDEPDVIDIVIRHRDLMNKFLHLLRASVEWGLRVLGQLHEVLASDTAILYRDTDFVIEVKRYAVHLFFLSRHILNQAKNSLKIRVLPESDVNVQGVIAKLSLTQKNHRVKRAGM
ncbi:hypothetical protein KKC31_02970, partial [Patescibacteria group bacterium]|nr:hypothetical protein [Patescibacteria group bacterium]